MVITAAFGRLCVETAGSKTPEIVEWQPPSGGCVLKPVPSFADTAKVGAAAFGRLCVETYKRAFNNRHFITAAFGRLCVETLKNVAFR